MTDRPKSINRLGFHIVGTSNNLLTGSSCVFFGGHRYRYRVLPLFKEGLLAPGISPEGRRACLLLGLARPLSFASREKEIIEPILREELKANPWSANVWQRSRLLPRRNHFY